MSLLHITNGRVVSDALHSAGIGGIIVDYADVLHEGMVPPEEEAEHFLRARAQEIARFGWATEAEAFADMQAGQRRLEAFRDYDDVVLWYEHDLFDQLLLIRLLSWWRRHGAAAPPRLVSPAAHLGELVPAQLIALYEAAARVTDAQMQAAAAAWRAFTAGDPAALVRVKRDAGTAELPHLPGALVRMLEEYPSYFNGLGRTEQQVLDILAQSPRDARELFTENARREERVFMGDLPFFRRLQQLKSVRQPLIEGEIDRGLLRLTDAGRSVQEGATDHVVLNGIDRWIGGVYLTASNVWRWNGSDVVRR